MTISNTSIRKAGPSQGNGVNTSFPFTFKVFTTADVLVTYLNASSIETVLALGTDYNVSLNADQNAAPGGIVNLLWPPTSSTYITLTSQVTNTQTLTLTNSGGFYPQSINDALDRVVILIQQLAEQTSRCFRLPISSAASPAPSIPNSPNTVLGFNASGVLSALPATTGTSLITLGSPAGAALIGWTQVGLGGNVNRNVASKLIDTISANDFGAVGDGTTINNTFLQSFINTATGKIAYIPAGIYVVSNLSIVAGLTLIGAGQGLTILKRPPSDPTNNSILNITGATNVSISGITFDGNKTNQTLGSNSVTIGSSSNLSILDCELINSKAASGQGNGLAFINNSGQSSKQKITIRNCRFSNNDSTDLYINLSWYIEVTSCFMKGSGGGISVMNNVFPPVTDSQDYLLLSNNMIRDQAGNGIWVNGFIVSGTSVAPTLGSTNPASRGFAVSGNLISNCTGYGIAWQGASGSVVNNEIYQCGTIYGGGGVVFNAYASVFSGNTIRDCYNYGIDAGGAQSVLIANNQFLWTGATQGTQTTDINCGGGYHVSVIGNSIEQAGAVTRIGIGAKGCEGDNTAPFGWTGQGLLISNNYITLNGAANSLGIWVWDGEQRATLQGNQVNGAATIYNAIRAEVQGISTANNTDEASYASSGTPLPGVTAATTLVIPDTGDRFLVSGNTTITSLQTYSSNVYNGKVRIVPANSQGSGYSTTTPPTATFSGGGGAGLAATARVTYDGRVVEWAVTNPGSGYTSAPTPTITHNGGTGATANPVINCNNTEGREITLFFQSALTLTNGSNLVLNGNYVTTANVSAIKLFSIYGNWYEVSRR